jgi:hypothetical protein
MGSTFDVRNSYTSQQILGAFDSCFVLSIIRFPDAVDFIYEYADIINRIYMYLILLIKTRI